MHNDLIKVLVIDDSAYNRKTIADYLNEVPEIEVVGKAYDGQEGLQMVHTLKPDVITLDLEMPRMDGFSFLRLLMQINPTPVIVVSSHSHKSNVFQALELGAVDFVAKPTHRISPEIVKIKEDIIEKVLLAANLTPNKIRRLSTLSPPPEAPSEDGMLDFRRVAHRAGEVADKVVLIAASTGGPATITGILSSLPQNLNLAVVIVQHMPAGFTTSFAERLDSKSRFSVIESYEEHLLRRGMAYVSPGDKNLEIFSKGGKPHVRAVSPLKSDKYVPSADRLFETAADTMGASAMAVVLTGMGDDGSKGSVIICDRGGSVIAESHTTAVIDGMPRSALLASSSAISVPANEIAAKIEEFAR